MEVYAAVLEWFDKNDESFGSNFWLSKTKEGAEKIIEEEFEYLKKTYDENCDEYEVIEDENKKEIIRFDGDFIDILYITVKAVEA